MERIVQSIMNEGYGDQSTSPLDRVVASKIVDAFRRSGWISGQELGFVVKAAGGEIRLTEELLSGQTPAVLQYRDGLTQEVVLKSVDTQRNPSPAEREASESRTVQSGPIKVRPAVPSDSAGPTEEKED